jgi:hypothetical protein
MSFGFQNGFKHPFVWIDGAGSVFLCQDMLGLVLVSQYPGYNLLVIDEKEGVVS